MGVWIMQAHMHEHIYACMCTCTHNIAIKGIPHGQPFAIEINMFSMFVCVTPTHTFRGVKSLKLE